MGTSDLTAHAHDAVAERAAIDDMSQYSVADSGDKPSQHQVVELTANAAGNSGKMKKSGSGFLKGLLRNKSSGNLTDGGLEHREASGPPSENGGIHAADDSSEHTVPAKKKGVKKLLGLGRSKKKSGSSASLSEHAEPEAGTDAEP